MGRTPTCLSLNITSISQVDWIGDRPSQRLLSSLSWVSQTSRVNVSSLCQVIFSNLRGYKIFGVVRGLNSGTLGVT